MDGNRLGSVAENLPQNFFEMLLQNHSLATPFDDDKDPDAGGMASIFESIEVYAEKLDAIMFNTLPEQDNGDVAQIVTAPSDPQAIMNLGIHKSCMRMARSDSVTPPPRLPLFLSRCTD
jgi:hypothetical protein